MPRQGDRLAIARSAPRFRMLSSNETTLQVDQATHTKAVADFAQLRAAGCEESAQQPIPAKLFHLNPPALGATAQPYENFCQLRGDRRLAFAKKPAGVVDQLDITSQRKARNHAFTRGIQLAAVIDRTKPQRLFQAGRRLRTGNAAATGCFQCRDHALSFDMVHSPLDRCIVACFRSLRDLRGQRIQINVDTDRQQRLSSSRTATLLKRPSKKVPRVLS